MIDSDYVYYLYEKSLLKILNIPLIPKLLKVSFLFGGNLLLLIDLILMMSNKFLQLLNPQLIQSKLLLFIF